MKTGRKAENQVLEDLFYEFDEKSDRLAKDWC
jgi:hypothetical protein